MKACYGYGPLSNLILWYPSILISNRSWDNGAGCHERPYPASRRQRLLRYPWRSSYGVVYPAGRVRHVCVVAILLLSGCATSGPPTQEMSDARQALDAARQVDAASHAPETLQDAQSLLSKAEEKLSEGAFAQAQHDALAAKAEATRARTMAAAISETKAVLQEVDSFDALSTTGAGGAHELLRQAEAAALINDDQAVVRLAREARQRAEHDMNHALLGKTQTLLTEVYTLQPFSDAQRAEVRAIEETYRRGDGKSAYVSIRRLVDELREMKRRSQVVAPPRSPPSLPVVTAVAPSVTAGMIHYTVRQGDSLWNIAARPEIYANPLRWSIIYKTNQQHIRNANVIFPGQVLMIKRHEE